MASIKIVVLLALFALASATPSKGGVEAELEGGAKGSVDLGHKVVAGGKRAFDRADGEYEKGAGEVEDGFGRAADHAGPAGHVAHQGEAGFSGLLGVGAGLVKSTVDLFGGLLGGGGDC